MTPFETFFAGEWSDKLKRVPDQSLSWDRKAAWLYWTDAMGRKPPTFSADRASVIEDAGDSLDDLFG